MSINEKTKEKKAESEKKSKIKPDKKKEKDNKNKGKKIKEINTEKVQNGKFVKKKSVNKKTVIIAFSVVAIICILVGSFFAFGGIDLIKGLYSTEEEEPVIDSTVIGNKGFPVNFMSNDIVSADGFSSRIFVLTSKLLTSVRSNGEVDFTQSFTFVKPQMSVSDKYGVVYDKGSGKFIIFNSGGIVYQGTIEDNRHIITAKIDNKGNCAIVTKSTDSACRVYLVNKRGEILYIWSCVEEYAVALDISGDGNTILCGALGAYNGEVLTRLYKLNVNSTKVSSFVIPGSACVDVSFYGGSKAIVTCIDKRVILDLRTEDGAPLEAKYPSDALYISCDSNGYCAVVTDKLSSFDKDEITVYNHNNSVIYKSEIAQGSNDIECVGKRVYLLTDGGVDYLDAKGTLIKSVSCGTRPEGLAILMGKAYFYTAGTLNTGF